MRVELQFKNGTKKVINVVDNGVRRRPITNDIYKVDNVVEQVFVPTPLISDDGLRIFVEE